MRFRLPAQPNGDVWNDPVRGLVPSDGPYAETCLDAIALETGAIAQPETKQQLSSTSRARKGDVSIPDWFTRLRLPKGFADLQGRCRKPGID